MSPAPQPLPDPSVQHCKPCPPDAVTGQTTPENKTMQGNFQNEPDLQTEWIFNKYCKWGLNEFPLYSFFPSTGVGTHSLCTGLFPCFLFSSSLLFFLSTSVPSRQGLSESLTQCAQTGSIWLLFLLLRRL